MRYISVTSVRPRNVTEKNQHPEPADDPALKEATRIVAVHDHRSVGNLIELLIRRHCESVGIPNPEQSELFGDADQK